MAGGSFQPFLRDEMASRAFQPFFNGWNGQGVVSYVFFRLNWQHTHTKNSPVAINTELNRFEFLLIVLLIRATKTVFKYTMHSWTPEHTRSVEVYFRFDENEKREPASFDEIRTSAQAKVNWYWERYSLDGVFDYCQNFEIAEWFLKSRTRLVDGYCFRRVDTW